MPEAVTPTALSTPSRPGGAIVLAPPDATWSAAFTLEASIVSDMLSHMPIDVHHIGSTAIPGIVAKPVIDMLGVVPAVRELDACAHRLAALGYEALGRVRHPGSAILPEERT